MSIRCILVPIDGTETSKPSLHAAFTIGRELNASVEVLHVRPNPKDAVPLLGEGMSGTMIEEMIEIAEKEAGERANRARALFDEYCAAFKVTKTNPPLGPAEFSATWRDETGREDEITALRGRLSDLIVIARPTAESPAAATMMLNAALVETGRGTLVVPVTGLKTFGQKVAISWNGSGESARAVAAALSIIKRAQSVLIITVQKQETETSVAPDLAAYLSRHGIDAKVDMVYVGDSPAGAQVGEAVLRNCAHAGADLLIMGAYTHSRWRQLIFGGVTRYVLNEATIPVVMVH